MDGAWIRLGRLQSAGRCLQSARTLLLLHKIVLIFSILALQFFDFFPLEVCLPDLNIYGALHHKSSASSHISHQILQSSTSFYFFLNSIESSISIRIDHSSPLVKHSTRLNMAAMEIMMPAPVPEKEPEAPGLPDIATGMLSCAHLAHLSGDPHN